jgi:HEAT repeat protein
MAQGKDSPGFDAHAFADVIDRAALTPESFADQVGPVAERQFELCLPLLLKVFDGPLAPSKQAVADLFKTRLAPQAPAALLPWLEEQDPDRFSWAVTILADLKIEAALPGLQKALWSGKKNIVQVALRAIAGFPGAESINILTDFLFKASDWVYFTPVLRVLAPRAGELVPFFLQRFDSLPKDRQAWVLKYLAETGDARALDLFARTLAADPLQMGIFSIVGLGRIGTPDAVKALAGSLTHEEWFIRKRVVDALGNATCRDAIPLLLRGLIDPSLQVRAGAVESLSKVGSLDLDALIGALDKAGHDLRIGLIRVYGQIHSDRLVRPLISTLTDRSTLFFSLDALGDLGFAEAAPALEAFLNDESWFNRLNALEALGKLQLPHIRQLAEKCLEDSNDMVRNAAERIMAQFQGQAQKKG